MRVFLDTNVFIYSFEFQNSNSSKIIDLLNKGEIEAVISENVLQEVVKYFEKYHNIKLARLFRRYLLESCLFIRRDLVIDAMERYNDQIKEKDIEQIAVTKKLEIKYLISYDKDFGKFEEYKTPKEFLKILKIKNKETEY